MGTKVTATPIESGSDDCLPPQKGRIQWQKIAVKLVRITGGVAGVNLRTKMAGGSAYGKIHGIPTEIGGELTDVLSERVVKIECNFCCDPE